MRTALHGNLFAKLKSRNVTAVGRARPQYDATGGVADLEYSGRQADEQLGGRSVNPTTVPPEDYCGGGGAGLNFSEFGLITRIQEMIFQTSSALVIGAALVGSALVGWP